MRTLVDIARVGLAVGLAFSAAACSDDAIDGPPDPGTVRVFLDREFDYTWQLGECETANDDSLAVNATDGQGGSLLIDIIDGAGDVTIVQDSVATFGVLDSYEMDEDQVFTANGTYESGEESGPIELEGNCS